MRIHHAIQLQHSGRLVRMEWNKELERNVEYIIPSNELVYHLHDSICFADGVTLRDLFRLMTRDSNLFMMLTACDCFMEIVDELKVEATSVKEMTALELAWRVEIESLDTTTVIDTAVEFYGLGDEGQVGLEFTSVAHLADCLILLNEVFNVRDETNHDKVVFSTTRKFTLLEVVCGVIEELTFFGSPKKRDEALADLHNRVATVDKGKLYTIEEIKAKWERFAEENKKRFPCRMCGKDSRCACFGKPSDICHNCFINIKKN